MSEWYYTHAGQRFGPVSVDQLRRAAQLGQVAGGDLVWHEGMANWAPASTVPAVFPASVPPAIPPVPRTPPPIPQAPTAYAPPSAAQPVQLWNPMGIRIGSFFLSPAFGAFLTAKNWTALGDSAAAQKAMYWFYGVLALFAALFFLGASPDAVRMKVYAFLGSYVAWVLFQSEPQRKRIGELRERYQRLPFGQAIGIAIACIAGYVVIGMLFTSI